MNKTYEELFGPDDEWGFSYPSYDAIVAAIGNVVIEESFGSYQGDTFYLIEKDGKLGYLSIGWGSCGGCDALEACYSNKAEVMQLAQSIESDVKWFDDKAAAVAYFKDHDWAGDWCFEYNRDFVQKCWEHLGIEGEVPRSRR
jgi:hypothetical protein